MNLNAQVNGYQFNKMILTSCYFYKWNIDYLLVELRLVVVDVDELDGDDGVAEPLFCLTLSSGSSSNLNSIFKD